MSLKRVLIPGKTYPTIGLELLGNSVQSTVLPNLDHYPEFLPDVRKNLPGVDALIWNTKHRLTGELLDLAGPSLKAVSSMSSGLDHIDLAAVKKRGILLGNTPQVLDNTVADTAIGLLIAAGRRFKEGINEVKSGEWKYGVQWRLGQDIAGSTVGIVGLGGIGQAVVRRLKGFDVAKFIYSGRTDKSEARALGAERVPLDQLTRESDFIILCCPLTNETKHMVNAQSIKNMKENVVIINIGRGELIDQDALYDALKGNRIFAAGLDVTTPEPIPKDHPLVALPNCFILPHVGSATFATRNAMATIAARNILLALDGKTMQFPVLL